MLIFIVAVVILSSVFYFLNAKDRRVERIEKAFAGTPKSGDTVVELSCEANKTIYSENGVEVDLSKMRKFILEGESLYKLGLPHGTIVYTDMNYDPDNLSSLAERFIILKIDNNRIMKEHPEITSRVTGYKARKAVDCFPTTMDDGLFTKRMTCLLKGDSDIREEDIPNCTERLMKKFKFAAEYYKEDKYIIVSVTYKDGECKDYSFHSLKLLEGIVRYKNV